MFAEISARDYTRAQCYNAVEKLAKTKNVETVRNTDRFGAAVFAYLLGYIDLAPSVRIGE